MKSQPARHLLRIFQGTRRSLAAGLAISVLQLLPMLPVPWLVREIFDRWLPARDVRRVTVDGLAMLALLATAVALGAAGRHLCMRATKVAVGRLRRELLAKLYRLPRAYYDRGDKAQIHDVIVNDTERLDMMVSALLVQVIPPSAVALALGAVLFWLNPELFLAAALVVPGLFLVGRLSERRLRQSANRFRQAFAAFSRGTYAMLRHLDLTRLHGAEGGELSRQNQRIETLQARGTELVWQQGAHARAQQYGLGLVGVGVLILGSLGISEGRLSVGELMSFYAVVGLMSNYLRDIATGLGPTITGYESLIAICNLLEAEDRLPYHGCRTIAFTGRVALEEVCFHYEGAGEPKPVLRGAALRLAPGTITALAGRNGAGKSTVLHLITGLYRPQRGRVLADDIPYDEIDLAALRRQIGVVVQDPVIFSGTIRDNIAYGEPTASPEAVRAATRLALAHSFIAELPEGYETRVGDEGVLLSGGQRQSLALARALLGRPRLLVLDEPTNHLDAEAIQALARNLRALEAAPAVLLISHSPPIIAAADEGYAVVDGVIVPLPSGPGSR